MKHLRLGGKYMKREVLANFMCSGVLTYTPYLNMKVEKNSDFCTNLLNFCTSLLTFLEVTF